MIIMLIHSGIEPDHRIDCSLSPSDTSLPLRVLSYRHYLIMKGFATQGIGYIHNEFVIERKVRIGFEPTHERFAVTCLTTWLPNLIVLSFGSHECEEFLLSQSVAVANLCVPVTLFTYAHENLFYSK